METFSIVRSRHGWSLLVSGKRRGRYRFRADAEEAALRLARVAISHGETVEVLVEDPDGRMTRLEV